MPRCVSQNHNSSKSKSNTSSPIRTAQSRSSRERNSTAGSGSDKLLALLSNGEGTHFSATTTATTTTTTTRSPSASPRSCKSVPATLRCLTFVTVDHHNLIPPISAADAAAAVAALDPEGVVRPASVHKSPRPAKIPASRTILPPTQQSQSTIPAPVVTTGMQRINTLPAENCEGLGVGGMNHLNVNAHLSSHQSYQVGSTISICTHCGTSNDNGFNW